MKGLEFNIVNNNRLDVLDFSWHLNTINAIYISQSRWTSKIKPQYAIYIQSNLDLIELYYRTDDELDISNRFRELCEAIEMVNPNFKTYFPYCLNIENVKDFSYEKAKFRYNIIIDFDGEDFMFKMSTKNLNRMLNDLNQNKDGNIGL